MDVTMPLAQLAEMQAAQDKRIAALEAQLTEARVRLKLLAYYYTERHWLTADEELEATALCAKVEKGE